MMMQMPEEGVVQRGFRWKKFLMGIPSVIGVAIIGFFTYEVFLYALPLVESPILKGVIFLVHCQLLVFTLWSLVKTMVTNPGYLE